MVLGFLLIASASLAGETKRNPASPEMTEVDSTTVLNVADTVKVKVITYSDDHAICYVMIPTGSYTNGSGSAVPVSAVSGISCIKK